MNKYELLKDLLFYLEDFENESNKIDIKEFSIYLKDKVFSGERPKKAAVEGFDYVPGMNYRDIPEVEFSTLVGTMFRFARHYVKKALENSAIKSLDEFGFLATLVEKEQLNKSELINVHLMEISSGSEILKRLVKKNFIQEIEDIKDKRGVRVELTNLGRKEIFAAFGEMYKVSQVVKGNLTTNELTEMNFLLNKLKSFHWNIHENDKSANIDFLVQKYAN
jgi:MarR family transcriptional regulator, lower aerobic nicotinate degradation pathway regulator